MVYGFDFSVLGAKIQKGEGRRICLLYFFMLDCAVSKDGEGWQSYQPILYGKNKRFGMALIVSDLQAETFVFIRL